MHYDVRALKNCGDGFYVSFCPVCNDHNGKHSKSHDARNFTFKCRFRFRCELRSCYGMIQKSGDWFELWLIRFDWLNCGTRKHKQTSGNKNKHHDCISRQQCQRQCQYGGLFINADSESFFSARRENAPKFNQLNFLLWSHLRKCTNGRYSISHFVKCLWIQMLCRLRSFFSLNFVESWNFKWCTQINSVLFVFSFHANQFTQYATMANPLECRRLERIIARLDIVRWAVELENHHRYLPAHRPTTMMMKRSRSNICQRTWAKANEMVPTKEP